MANRHNDVSVDGKLCTCNRQMYDKHADFCPARKQCFGCDRNLFETHKPDCSWVEPEEEYTP